MDVFDENLLKFWETLNNCGVKYIMVGGLSVNFNGHHRVTDDVHIWIKDTLSNRKILEHPLKNLAMVILNRLRQCNFYPAGQNFM